MPAGPPEHCLLCTALWLPSLSTKPESDSVYMLHPDFLLSPGFIDPVNIIAHKVTVFNCLCFLSWGCIAALLGGLEILSCDTKPCLSERLLTLFNMSARFFFYELHANEMVCIKREPYVSQRHARLQTAGSNSSPSVTYQPWHPCHFP